MMAETTNEICPENLFSISSCDLNTKFNDRCYADWSRTNLISFVTLDGIYILKPQLEKRNAPFEIELIKHPTNEFHHKPFLKPDISLDGTWNALDNRQYTDAYLDPALHTILPKLSSNSYPRRFRIAKWSPVIDTFPKQCLLAVITVDYQLLIYTREDGIWTVAHDLSQAYDDIWIQSPILSASMTDTSYEGLRRSAHALSFGTVCWKETKEGHQYLLATTLTGDILIWDLTLASIGDAIYQNDAISFGTRLILRTGQNHINEMKFCDQLCIATTRSGQVNLYDLNVIFEELDSQNASQTGDKKGGNKNVSTFAIIDVAHTAILWQQDNIEVADFYLQTISQDTFRIVLAKATNICWCTIHYKPKTGSEQATLSISDSFSAIDGLDPEVSLHQTPATWLRPAGQKRAVLISDDGSFFRLEFINERQDTSPTFSAMSTGKIDLIGMIPRGLCTSPRGHLVTMISCATFMVDPLKIPASTRLIIVPIINGGKFFDDCLKQLLDEAWLSINEVESPMDARDLMDSVLSIFPLLNHQQYALVFAALKDELTRLIHSSGAKRFVKMKIVNFMMSKLLSLDGFKKNDSELMSELENNIASIILLDHIEQILVSALDTGKSGDQSKKFRDDQVISLRNCMSWLDKSSPGQLIRDRHKVALEKLISTNRKQVHQEICPMCKCDIPFESYSYGTCTNKHRFDRCSRSLLIVNHLEHVSLRCPDCQRIYMTELVWPTKNLWLCLYCQ